MVCQVSGPPEGVAAALRRSFPEVVPPPELYHKFVLLSRCFFFFRLQSFDYTVILPQVFHRVKYFFSCSRLILCFAAIFRLHRYFTTGRRKMQAFFENFPGISRIPHAREFTGGRNTLQCTIRALERPYFAFSVVPPYVYTPRQKSSVERIYFKNYYQ